MNLKKAAQKKLKKSGGFTLIEMLIVVAIIAILVVVSIPMVSGSLDKAKQATDDANERAAKAVAMVTFMTTNPSVSDEGITYYYKDDGTVSTGEAPSSTEGYSYGQSKDNEGKYVQVKLTKDGIVAATDGIKWEKVTSSGS